MTQEEKKEEKEEEQRKRKQAGIGNGNNQESFRPLRPYKQHRHNVTSFSPSSSSSSSFASPLFSPLEPSPSPFQLGSQGSSMLAPFFDTTPFLLVPGMTTLSSPLHLLGLPSFSPSTSLFPQYPFWVGPTVLPVVNQPQTPWVAASTSQSVLDTKPLPSSTFPQRPLYEPKGIEALGKVMNLRHAPKYLETFVCSCLKYLGLKNLGPSSEFTPERWQELLKNITPETILNYIQSYNNKDILVKFEKHYLEQFFKCIDSPEDSSKLDQIKQTITERKKLLFDLSRQKKKASPQEPPDAKLKPQDQLMRAIQENSVPKVRLLINGGNIENVNYTENGESFLTLAIQKTKDKIFEMVLSLSPNLGYQNKDGYIALTLAVMLGREREANLILARGEIGATQINSKTMVGNTQLIAMLVEGSAASQTITETVFARILQTQPDLSALQAKKNNSILMCALNCSSPAIATLFLKKTPEELINFQNTNKETALYLAVLRLIKTRNEDWFTVVCELVAKKADLTIRPANYDDDVLELAVKSRQIKLVYYFLKSGARVSMSALTIAIDSGYKDIMVLLLSWSDRLKSLCKDPENMGQRIVFINFLVQKAVEIDKKYPDIAKCLLAYVSSCLNPPSHGLYSILQKIRVDDTPALPSEKASSIVLAEKVDTAIIAEYFDNDFLPDGVTPYPYKSIPYDSVHSFFERIFDAAEPMEQDLDSKNELKPVRR